MSDAATESFTKEKYAASILSGPLEAPGSERTASAHALYGCKG